MQHHNSTVFLKSYLSRYITGDTGAAYRGLEPQTALMRLASGMSRTIDRRRPRKLDAAQRAEVDRHPEVRLLRRRQKTLSKFIREKHGSVVSMKGTPVYDEYQNTYHAHRNMKRRREEALLQEVKARYKREQPVIDIQRQLKGLPSAELEKAKAEDYVFVERVRVIDAIFTFATSSPEEECRRRVEAINALTALCRLQEGKRTRRLKPSASDSQPERDLTRPAVLHLPSLSDSIPIECEATQCIFCLGCEALPTETRLKSFHSRGDLKKHFHRKHLRHHPAGQRIACPHPRCHVDLGSTVHSQNHADLVHKTPT